MISHKELSNKCEEFSANALQEIKIYAAANNIFNQELFDLLLNATGRLVAGVILSLMDNGISEKDAKNLIKKISYTKLEHIKSCKQYI